MYLMLMPITTDDLKHPMVSVFITDTFIGEEVKPKKKHYQAYMLYDSGTIPTHRPMQAEAFRHIGQVAKADDLMYTRSRRLPACTKSMTFGSPFLCIIPSQRPVFSVCPVYNHLYPCVLCYILISDRI
jgi:hypothetical protein